MENMISMLESLYAYNYGTNNEYYRKLEKEYGADIVRKKWEEIERDYEVEYNTYTDSEGGTYNSLKKRGA